MKIKEIIVEGGNIWKDNLATVRIQKKSVLPTVKFLEKITGLSLIDNILGSAGKAETSGDIDIAIDAAKYNKEDLVARLKAYSPDAQVKKTGISVHFRCPIEGNPKNNFVQIDFMFMNDMNFAKWIYSPQGKSKYKNAVRTFLMASIAKFFGLRFSAERGLVSRETNTPLKNGTNPTFIAKILLGKNATEKDLSTAENIIDYLKDDPKKDEKLADGFKLIESFGFYPSE